MPITIALGVIFHSFFARFAFLTPYLIFVMLFLTFSKMRWHNIRLSKLHLWLILIQILGGIGLYWLVLPVSKTLAQGMMICVIAPTATSAPVITGMLKGNVESLTAYSLLSNICVAVITPLFFSVVGETASLSFGIGVFTIAKSVLTVILAPLLLAFLLKIFLPKTTRHIASVSSFSFWLWTLALAIVTARTTAFILAQDSSNFYTEIALAVGALVVCILLFAVGKSIGKKYNETIAAGQSLGQKNTVLAIWMAQTYLNPLSSIAPGMYVLWQNMFNSWQIWREARR